MSQATMSVAERIAFEASVALVKDTALARGWKVGSSPNVKAKIEAYNQREYERCEAAALALLEV